MFTLRRPPEPITATYSERALSLLDPAHQQILLLTYRDGIRHAQAASMLGCSVKTVYYLLPATRRRLVDTLDRLDLL